MNPPMLMPPVPGRPLILYMIVLDESMGCVLGQHDESEKRERDVYYLSKKFDIVYVTQKAIKESALADYLA